MAASARIRLPRHWPRHVKSSVLHAISLAGVAITVARAKTKGRRRLLAQLDEARSEIA